jgi:hypothetical protein
MEVFVSTIKPSTLKNEVVTILARLVPKSRRAALGGLIPETNWDTLELPKFEEVTDLLSKLDPLGPEIVGYLKKRKYRIGFITQPNSGAGWTVLGNITLPPAERKRLLDAGTLSLIVHEAFHLQGQSILMRLSMKGELLAWQYQARTYPLFSQGKGIGTPGEAYSGAGPTNQHWEALLTRSADSRKDLEDARDLMIAIAPTYRAYALPIYPLHQEIGYYLRQGNFKGIIEMFQNLMKGASGQKLTRTTPEPQKP